MEREKLTFTIEGNDVEKVNAFKRKHEKCLQEHPNMTGAHYEYSFTPDGLGILASIKCVCGDYIILDDDYNLTTETGEKNFEVVPKDDETLFIVKSLLNMKRRPGMYFGKEKSILCLKYWLIGFQMAMIKMGKEIYWNEMRGEIERAYDTKVKGQEYSDEELFDVYLDTFEDILRSNYRQYAKENDLFA